MLGFIPQKRSAVLLSQARSGPRSVSAADQGEDLFFMTSADQDPRTLLLNGLDIDACRIEFSDAPVVLLCGGKVEFDAPSESPEFSLRHAISRSFTTFEIFRPEEIKSWQADSIFSDLISFERELASICSIVVIVLESEGALAELGAFSQLSELSEKIIAIRSSHFVAHDSFINLGILRFIAAKKHSAIKSYPWDIKDPSSITSEMTQDVIADIKEELSKLPQSQILRPQNKPHVITLICEFVRLFMALKENEIFDYLLLVGASTTIEQLRGQLFLLNEFRLIQKQMYGDAIFYMRSDVPFHKLRIAMKEKNASVDQLRIETQCSEYYAANSEKHRNRNRAIAAAKREI